MHPDARPGAAAPGRPEPPSLRGDREAPSTPSPYSAVSQGVRAAGSRDVAEDHGLVLGASSNSSPWSGRLHLGTERQPSCREKQSVAKALLAAAAVVQQAQWPMSSVGQTPHTCFPARCCLRLLFTDKSQRVLQRWIAAAVILPTHSKPTRISDSRASLPATCPTQEGRGLCECFRHSAAERFQQNWRLPHFHVY